MSQLVPFVIHLALVTWLRAAAAPRWPSSRMRRWYVEVAYGLLIAFPLLPARL